MEFNFQTAVSILGLLGIGALIDRFLSYFLQVRKENQEKKFEVYRRLIGARIILRQVIVSRTEAYIFSDYFEFRYKLTRDKWDFDESVRWMHKSEDYVQVVTKELQELFSILADISILFKDKPEIQLSINKLYKYKTLKIYLPADKLTIKQLEEWKTKGVKQMQELVENEYGKLLEKLINQIHNQI